MASIPLLTENIAENKYDTLGLKAAYLATGQARSVRSDTLDTGCRCTRSGSRTRRCACRCRPPSRRASPERWLRGVGLSLVLGWVDRGLLGFNDGQEAAVAIAKHEVGLDVVGQHILDAHGVRVRDLLALVAKLGVDLDT